jgi:hypothetical protein
MEQNKILEIILAKMDDMKASQEEIKANQHETKANQGRTNASLAEMKATIRSGQEEMIKAITGVSRESTEACEEKTKVLPETTEACPEVTHACLEEEKESTPKETYAVEEPQEFPKGATDEEKFGATEDRAGDLRLAVRRHRQRNKRAQENGGPRQKFAAFHRRFTHRAVPALLKGHVRKGPRKNCRSGTRGPGKMSRSRTEGWSLKQRQIQVNVARDTPEGRMDEKRRRTCLECNSGIWKLNKVSRTGKIGRIVKRDQLLDRKKTYTEAIRKSLCMEIVKLMIESSVGLREPGNGTLWKCRPLPKRKR